MEVEYKKNLHQKHMVIKGLGEKEKHMEMFCIRMLENNLLDNIIPFERRNINDKVCFYYDITSKQTLDKLYENSYMSYKQVRKLLLDIIDTIEGASEYLLNEDDFIIRSDYIFLDLQSQKANLCYLSGYHKDIKQQVSDLLEYMMVKVDYNDRAAVLLVYNLYAICREDSYSFVHLKEAILSSSKEDGYEEKKVSKIESKKEVVSIMEEDKEKPYSIKTYILTVLALLGGVMVLIITYQMGFIKNSLGSRVEFASLLLILSVLCYIEVYIIKSLWTN